MDKNSEIVEIEKISELLKKAKTDDGTFESTLYDLYLFIEISKGVRDINEGNGMTIEDLQREMEALYESTSRKFD